ncbi:MAG: tRNA pseudouridine(38-40) synthase TruA [Bariatricus sp.]|nr:tRNA pseudouridine(38-40) synthase TruA [Bariatricus sp.]
MSQNYRFTISYDGTRYSGWQSQGNTDATIQGKIEAVLSKMAGSKVELIGAGRTDAGVHAKEMTANVLLETSLSVNQIREYMNRYLPADICVLDVREAAPRFHSRYMATGKTYEYTCYYGPAKPIFDRNYVYILDKAPNIENMKKAAGILTGQHDFKSFCGNPKFKKSTVRTIDSIQIVQKGPYIKFTYHGDGFLQNMVRILTGTLLEVGFGMRTPEDMEEILRDKDRKKAGFMAPACGLCLVKVDYS